MNRNQAKEMLPIIQAYAEGKEIEIFDKTTKMWKTAMLPHFDCDSKNYRIKPEQKYRPFKDAEECWQEMQKHQPFGWVRAKEDKSLSLITLMISERDIFINCIGGSTMYDLMEKFTFADGAVFGILEKE